MTLPNILTVFRIVLIPVFVFFFFSEVPNNLTYAFLVFFIAGITDVLDGYIARKYHLVSDLGKVLDPLADKMMLLAVLICLATTNLVPLWVLLLIMLKEIVMISGGIYLYFSNIKIIIPSNHFGKLGTVLFYLAICMVLLEAKKIVALTTLYLAVLMAVVAFVIYLKIAIDAKKEINP